MPRAARKKSIESIYHVMFRSVGGIDLFEDEVDKMKYLSLIKRYQVTFDFKVYAYCLMDNHGHVLIDANGADISKFMKGINQSYAQYYNRKYSRYGHVFADRFKSKIIEDDRYLFSVAAYIHQNPKDISKWQNKLEAYPFSSLGVYLGNRSDDYDLLDTDFIMYLFDLCLEGSKEKYLVYMNSINNTTIKASVEFEDEKSEYRSERVILRRNFKPRDVVGFVADYLGVEEEKIFMKYRRKSTAGKALSILLMRRFCDFTVKEICKEITNITQSRVSRLSEVGLELVIEEGKYKGIIEAFMRTEVA